MLIFIEGFNIQGHKTGVCHLLQAGGGTARGKIKQFKSDLPHFDGRLVNENVRYNNTVSHSLTQTDCKSVEH